MYVLDDVAIGSAHPEGEVGVGPAPISGGRRRQVHEVT